MSLKKKNGEPTQHTMKLMYSKMSLLTAPPPLSRLMRVNGTPETIIANILCNNGTAISNSANKNQ